MKDRPEPRPDGAEDDGWTRRKKAIREGVFQRVGGGRPTAAERKR
ncbi:MAG: hypothetical protein ACE37J_11520 [Pikeienuella sp.]